MTGAAAAALAGLGEAQAPPERVTVFPMPGSPAARAETQITLRGAAAGRLGTVEVSGSRTGAHPGALRAHSDGRGASFVPQRPFAVGEKVTVRTALPIPGARAGDYSFTVARWQVLAGTPSRLRGVASRARDGFETVIAARTRASHVAVRALDSHGRVLGTAGAERPRR